MRQLACAILLALGACSTSPPADEYVARVGDAQLMRSELQASMARLAVGSDTTEARSQIIEQWVTNELLYQEAQRLNLETRTEVQRRISEIERAVMVEALVTDLHESAPNAITSFDVEGYYEQNKEQLRLLEPFVRVRYLQASSRDSVVLAKQILDRTREAEADSVFKILADRFAMDPQSSLALSARHYGQGRLLAGIPEVHDVVLERGVNRPAVIVESDSTFHLVDVVARVPAGTVPELAWVEDLIRRQLSINDRRDHYERRLQELRTAAQARGDIDVR